MAKTLRLEGTFEVIVFNAQGENPLSNISQDA
jgi:hypothetical protein